MRAPNGSVIRVMRLPASYVGVQRTPLASSMYWIMLEQNTTIASQFVSRLHFAMVFNKRGE